MASQIDRVSIVKSITSNKFRFADYGFAHFVRNKMMEILVNFDTNGNGLFEEEQIKQALIEILHQNPNEVFYVVQNVFRYDRDNDRCVTYQQFINFSVEQHFGQLAIQRLHRKKLYSHGDKRIMNLEEFIKTMEYSLNTIEVHGDNDVYRQLFGEVDMDQDGYISYEDYFIFLKEYFGSKSMASEPSTPVQSPPKKNQFPIDNGASQRFAKLIYNQLKIIAMQIDYNRKMAYQIDEAQRFISQVLQANEEEVEAIGAHLMQGRSSMSYEEFLQAVVPFYFCQYYVNVTGLKDQRIDVELFLQVVKDASTSVVSVGPTEKTAKSIFHLANGSADTVMNIEQYVMLMGTIFENFKFDRRGLARGNA